MTEQTDQALEDIRRIIATRGCDVEAFAKALEITHLNGNNIPNILPRIHAQDIDSFDGNVNAANGEVRGSDWEWAATLVAAVNLTRDGQHGRLEDVTIDQVATQARAFHNQMVEARRHALS